MNMPEIGVAAVSRAGHDKGRAFLIVGRADSEHVLIADGRTRSIAQPKKKKLKHLHIEPKTADQVRESILSGKQATDADIRKALDALGYHAEGTEQEG